MFDLRQDERTFWKTMNPCRLHALFSAYSRPVKQRAAAVPTIGQNGKPVQYIDFDEPITEHKNLAELFMKG